VKTYPTNPALEAAIVAHPDEDTPRLAYADWLDEHGDPDRAAFIRVQCRLADMSPGDPAWVDLIEQQDELVARLKDRLAELSPDDPKRFYFGTDILDAHEEPFRRGFPYFIPCQTSGAEWTGAEVRRVAEALTRLVRTTTLRGFEPFSTPPERLTELLGAPVIAELTGLSIMPQGLNNGRTELVTFYRHLGTNPALRRIAHLYLYGADVEIPPAAVAELARAKTFDSVHRLTIQGLNAPKSVLDALTRAAWFRRVRHFRSHLTKPAVAIPMLTGLGKLPELHTLDLPELAPRAVSALATGKFPALARLMYNGPLGVKFAMVLAKARFPALAAFEASDGGAKNDSLAELLKANWFARLRVLDLSNNAIGDRGVKALAAHPVARTLRVLKLGDNPFGRDGLDTIAQPDTFPALTTLNLCSFLKQKGKPAELAAFLSALRLPHLRHLNLTGWPLGNDGAAALAANPAFAGLTRLTLDSCRIGDPGAKALFASPHLQNLVELQMSYNSIKSGADALADPAVMPRLGECWLSTNKIPKKAAAKLQRDGLYLIT
jgi:uncharacterized protein (TIGR02996 family)